METIQLPEVEHAEVSILVDNYSDILLGDTEVIKRLRVPPPDAPLAEHGLCYLVSVYTAGQKHTILMDAGISGGCLQHNAALFESGLAVQFGLVKHKVADVSCVVLSHGHFDHFGGLSAFLKQAGKKMPLIVHPAAFVERRIKMGPDFYIELPTLTENALTDAGALIDKRSQPSTIAGGAILVTGTVARTTGFETGMPGAEAKHNGQWVSDRFEDDQALAFRIKDQGLVVLGGCSHAGIINTVQHVRQITGIGKVHAVLGGFHLSGPSEPIIEPTVKAMQAIAPALVVPTHCTGWKAINAFAAAMPQQFALNSVGTTYLFGG